MKFLTLFKQLRTLEYLNNHLNKSETPLITLEQKMNSLCHNLILDLIIYQFNVLSSDPSMKHVKLLEYKQGKSIKFSFWNSPLLIKAGVDSFEQFMNLPPMKEILLKYSATQLKNDNYYSPDYEQW